MLNNKKYLLIDLDGTLVDTADVTLKPMKDGQVPTDISRIKSFNGATNFLKEARKIGFECIIISDSHPAYVNLIVRALFGNISALSLADKPNTSKTIRFLQEQRVDLSNSICYMIGDSWLDIELGRGLSIPTVLTSLYQAKNIEIRDGIGDYKRNIISGSTYYTKSYEGVLKILKNPLINLLCLESKFHDATSDIARKPCDDRKEDGKLTAYRVLARQSQGECDRYHATEKYFEFNRINRSKILLYTMREAIIIYLDKVLRYQSYSWNILTYVPDKSTTQPAKKMEELFELITEEIAEKTSNLMCLNIFEWSEDVASSTRKQPTAVDRRRFVGGHLSLLSEVDVLQKSVIILDDQYTTGATADSLVQKLRNRGAKNILFIALFHLITSVNSNKLCPKCLANGVTKQLQVKINRSDSSKFYSCVLPRYGGDGCGYTEKIK